MIKCVITTIIINYEKQRYNEGPEITIPFEFWLLEKVGGQNINYLLKKGIAERFKEINIPSLISLEPISDRDSCHNRLLLHLFKLEHKYFQHETVKWSITCQFASGTCKKAEEGTRIETSSLSTMNTYIQSTITWSNLNGDEQMLKIYRIEISKL
ncbi:hypothetical protein HZS_4350 [Henneguya salminicola]|nr:hypothetical protein HZS_4350 [Henneguya salminicola]